ncbi:hypothetical protein ONZ45_g5430 [Pleurotus djamor]|nr:hypothetical protein ONZ45_g5430 [Pleurotus djamor]
MADGHGQSDIESASLPPVKNLRSMFENLSEATNDKRQSVIGNGSELLAPSEPSSPRPRASSGGSAKGRPESLHHLRASSSSSNLRPEASPPAVKKVPPPPPPPRTAKALSPSPSPSPRPSPHLRPVPIPAALLNLSKLEFPAEASPPRSVPQRASSPRPPPVPYANKPGVPPRPSKILLNKEVPGILPVDQITVSPPGHSESEGNGLLASAASNSPPGIPPRPPKTTPNNAIPNILPVDLITVSPPGRSASESEEEDSLSASVTVNPPPALPPRKPTLLADSSSSSVASSSSGFDSASHSSRTSSETDPTPPLWLITSSSSTSSSTSTSGHYGARVPWNWSPCPAFAPLPMEGASAPSPLTPNTRKLFGTGKLPPPPTRTIALGEKLPPAKRPIAVGANGGSSDDEDEEEEAVAKGLDLLPDSSHSSRRPPTFSYVPGRTETRVSLTSYSNHYAVSGSQVVVATGHHLKIYDLALADDRPIKSLDTKEVGAKEVKITSLEFRASNSTADRGYILWIGTKDGHLFEMDVRSGSVCKTKYSAHLHAVTYIFRYGDTMISLDESGKALIFTPDPGMDVDLLTTTPRIVRVTDKQDFVRLFGGKLWTASRSDAHAPGTTSRIPIIRVYDLFAQGSTGRSVMPTEHVGPVTSATVLPSQPGTVYVGHEEGYVTIWMMEAEDGYPRCIEVIRVSASDVLCLEGVNDRLWAGGRNGTITAYDVSSRPFVVTNCWVAHVTMPVIRLSVDHIGIEKTKRLCVVSAGKDDQLKFWDGSLGLDRIENELIKHEKQFSTFRDARILLISWNVDAARPDQLNGDSINLAFLRDALTSVESPDIISFGFQEVIDLESRKMTAKNVLLGGKKKPEDGGLSDRVTGAYKRWHDALLLALRTAMPANEPYVLLHSESLVGLFSCVFVKVSQRAMLKDMSITVMKRGVGGRYGNKGGIISRYVIEDTSICWVNCHLAAGQHAVRQRNADISAVLESKTLLPIGEHPMAYVGGGDGMMVLDHEVVMISGDMNYRIDQRRDPIIAAVRAEEHSTLWTHDQLLKEIKFNKACRLRGFSEGPLDFAPTYKYDRRSSEYDSSEKRRSPAWCDRVLWRSSVPARVKQLHYQRYEANVSDHRPISAAFDVTVKRAQADLREAVRLDVKKKWSEEYARMVEAARVFYAGQALL